MFNELREAVGELRNISLLRRNCEKSGENLPESGIDGQHNTISMMRLESQY